MTRFEFTERLRKALSGRVSHSVVNENVAYYENYIDTEIKKGRSEKEVLEELGDPRLIARTIIDTTQETGGALAGEEERASSDRGFSGRIIRLPVWILMLILLFAVIVVFQIVGLLLPVLLPVALIYFLIRYFRRR